MPPPVTYPVETIAKLFDLTPRRVQQLSAAGVIPRAGHGKYELAPAVRGYVRYLKGADLGGAARADKERLLRARADLMEMEARRATGRLVDVDLVERTWTNIASIIRTRLLALPSKCAPILAGLDPSAAYNLLEAEVHAALQELSETEIEVETS
jgi:phage terminase Nu1 subunit (DNA packaging protein)